MASRMTERPSEKLYQAAALIEEVCGYPRRYPELGELVPLLRKHALRLKIEEIDEGHPMTGRTRREK